MSGLPLRSGLLVEPHLRDDGTAVVHVGGAVDIYDADGSLVEHIPPDVFSEIAQSFEEAGEGLATLPDQIAAIPDTLGAELDQAGAEIADALGFDGGSDPAPSGSGSGQCPGGSAMPSATGGRGR